MRRRSSSRCSAARLDRVGDRHRQPQRLIAEVGLDGGEVDDAEQGLSVRVEDRRCGAGPRMPVLAEVLGREDVHRLALRKRGAHPVGPSRHLGPFGAHDDAGVGRRTLAHLLVAGDVQHGPGAFGQDHDAGHVHQKVADIPHDGYRGFQKQLLGLAAVPELLVAEPPSLGHCDVDAERGAALPLTNQKLVVGGAAFLDVDQPGVEALPQAVDAAQVLVEAHIGA